MAAPHRPTTHPHSADPRLQSAAPPGPAADERRVALIIGCRAEDPQQRHTPATLARGHRSTDPFGPAGPCAGAPGSGIDSGMALMAAPNKACQSSGARGQGCCRACSFSSYLDCLVPPCLAGMVSSSKARTDSAPIPHRFRTDSASIPHRFRIDSASFPHRAGCGRHVLALALRHCARLGCRGA